MHKSLLAAAAMMTAIALPQTAQAEHSAATDYLVKQQVKEACFDGSGTFQSWGILEFDLTGDGRDDLILNHQAVRCDGPLQRSGFCGNAECTVNVYVREGQLLQHKTDLMTVRLDMIIDSPAVLRTYPKHGEPRDWQWNGNTFAESNDRWAF